ncbi:MAG: terpene cyclase/mutase family protein [Planctomycetes bacterium]|nr:terpene cyclase/mutase family protein [Planctomycetota bacterium]
MSTGTKIVIAVLGAGAIGVLAAAALVAAGWLFYGRTARHEVALAQRALLEARTQEVKRLAEAAHAEAAPQSEHPASSATADAAALAQRRKDAIARGTAYLLKEQAPDGSWGQGNVGITALCTDALLAAGYTAKDQPVRRAIDRILKAQQPDGGIYEDVGLKNYTTSIALMVLVEAGPAAYAEPIRKATEYLKKTQWDETETIDRAHPWYGGAGYGKHERPDLSNTQFFVEAMHRAGVPKDDPLWAKVVVFVSRAQDRSESNDGVFVGTDSGGMIYTPHKGGESPAGTVDLPDGRKGLKAYGSMTYAGFKSFIYADLAGDDPRVKAALDWIRKHWTFEENPELGQQGLFYYYHAAAKALRAWSDLAGESVVLDARRRPHDWRAELTEALLKRQRPDGSWTNEADRWYEGYPPVPTSYAIVALAQCQ